MVTHVSYIENGKFAVPHKMFEFIHNLYNIIFIHHHSLEGKFPKGCNKEQFSAINGTFISLVDQSDLYLLSNNQVDLVSVDEVYDRGYISFSSWSFYPLYAKDIYPLYVDIYSGIHRQTVQGQIL